MLLCDLHWHSSYCILILVYTVVKLEDSGKTLEIKNQVTLISSCLMAFDTFHVEEKSFLCSLEHMHNYKIMHTLQGDMVRIWSGSLLSQCTVFGRQFTSLGANAVEYQMHTNTPLGSMTLKELIKL